MAILNCLYLNKCVVFNWGSLLASNKMEVKWRRGILARQPFNVDVQVG
jgi:hypothetical protein